MGWHCKRDLRITLGESKALLNGGLFCCLFMMNLNVKSLFDQAAQDYDRTRRQFIPCFDAFYGMALILLPERKGLRVLDVGAGTGLLSGLIRAQRSDLHLTLADVSEAMLAKAQQRFANDAQVDYQVADFVLDNLKGSYDVVVSALALHHTPQSQLKAVFAKIYAALNPGGMFINADQVLGNTPENEAHYEAIWQAEVLKRGASQQDLNMAIERMKADRTATLENQLDWLCEVGFQHVECWFKEYRFAVYSGVK